MTRNIKGAPSLTSSVNLKPREVLLQQGTIGGAEFLGKVTAIRARENGGQFLQGEQVGIEWIDEGVDRVLQIAALNVVIALGEDSALFGADEDRFDIAAGQRAGAQVFANE